MSETIGEAGQTWRWCPRCERAFLSLIKNTCRYSGCDSPGIRNWVDFRSDNPSYPETPVVGHVYPPAKPDSTDFPSLKQVPDSLD